MPSIASDIATRNLRVIAAFLAILLVVVLAVGASDLSTPHPKIRYYSSRGPTLDGRVKPDIVGIALASPAGISFASLRVAGLAALAHQVLWGSADYDTPAEVAAYLKDAAWDQGDVGPDNTWWHGFAQMPASIDYDTDDDGLISISCLAQLNAIRWDLDGNGVAITGNEHPTGMPSPWRRRVWAARWPTIKRRSAPATNRLTAWTLIPTATTTGTTVRGGSPPAANSPASSTAMKTSS